MRKALARFLDNYPVADALMEMFAVWTFTFVPVAIAATMVQSRIPNFSSDSFWNVLYSFFGKGELSLLALGVAGSIFFIAGFRPSKLYGWVTGLLLLLVASSLLYLGAIIGNNPGFREPLPSWVLQHVFILYVVLNVLWFAFLSTSKNVSTSSSPVDEIDRSTSIIRASRIQRNN